jgi:hypothetical protein
VRFKSGTLEIDSLMCSISTNNKETVCQGDFLGSWKQLGAWGMEDIYLTVTAAGVFHRGPQDRLIRDTDESTEFTIHLLTPTAQLQKTLHEIHVPFCSMKHIGKEVSYVEYYIRWNIWKYDLIIRKTDELLLSPVIITSPGISVVSSYECSPEITEQIPAVPFQELIESICKSLKEKPYAPYKQHGFNIDDLRSKAKKTKHQHFICNDRGTSRYGRNVTDKDTRYELLMRNEIQGVDQDHRDKYRFPIAIAWDCRNEQYVSMTFSHAELGWEARDRNKIDDSYTITVDALKPSIYMPDCVLFHERRMRAIISTNLQLPPVLRSIVLTFVRFLFKEL